MSAVRIRRTIDSETLHLPELGAFIGRTVDIVIEDRPSAGTGAGDVGPGRGDWDTVLEAVRGLGDYDYDAQPDQDARDIRDAQDRAR